MSNTRLTVVVRKDLDMPVGLLAAQVAHMSDAFMRKRIIDSCFGESGMPIDTTDSVSNIFENWEFDWMKTPYLSVLAVNCYEDLVEIYEHVLREELPCHKWEDTIPSPTFEGKAIKAFVGISIGPEDFDAIKMITNGLSLY